MFLNLEERASVIDFDVFQMEEKNQRLQSTLTDVQQSVEQYKVE